MDLLKAPPPAISVRGLTKRYGARTAVDGLDVDVPAGAVVGFVGPNGAGKTTAMAMLLGLVRPTTGHGTVLGAPLRRPAAYLARVGALIETPAHYRGLTARENLRVLARVAGHPEDRIPELLDLVGLADRADERVRGYSLGIRQRLGIAGALLGDPELLILDEPTNGLDPAGFRELRALIARLADGRRTLLISSHVLAELDEVCDHLLVIEAGRLLYSGPVADFGGTTGVRVVAIPRDPEDAHRLHEVIEDAAAAAGIELAHLGQEGPSLEDRYLTATTGAAR